MRKKKDFFFLVSGIFFLAVTLIAFTPRLILRPWFRETELPWYFILHGIIMILWFLAYFHQTLLIYRGKVPNHRKNGRYWFLLAVLMTLANLYVLRGVSREALSGTQTYWEGLRTPESAGLLVLGTGYLVLAGSILLVIAYMKRNRAPIHKRAVFGASVLLVNPAFDRFLRPFELDAIHPLLPVTLINILTIALIVYDLKKRKKLYWVTIVFALMMLLTIPFVFGLSGMGVGVALVEFLGS